MMAGDVAHFVLVPFMAQGHIIPMVDFGRVLAEHGMQVSLITTPFNLCRLQATVDRIDRSGLLIDFVSLCFPTEEVGLPEGYENVDVIPSPKTEVKSDLFHKFFKGAAMLAEPLEAYIQQMQHKNLKIPIIMVTDFCNPWTRKVSEKLDLPRLVFYSVCCYTLIFDKIFERNSEVGNVFVVPDLEQRIEVPRPTEYIFFSTPEFEYMRLEIKNSDQSADGLLINTFYELEPMFIERYSLQP